MQLLLRSTIIKLVLQESTQPDYFGAIHHIVQDRLEEQNIVQEPPRFPAGDERAPEVLAGRSPTSQPPDQG